MILAGCMEKGPLINFTNVIVADTTYTISPVPAADPHNVLAEEFTGQSCPNCPNAHIVLDGLAPGGGMTTGGTLNILGLYIYNVVQANPPSGFKYDFRTTIGTDISNNIYAAVPGSGIPVGGIDRVIPPGGALCMYATAWPAAYNARLAITDSINLAVTSAYSASDTTATIVATTTYLQQMSTNQNLCIAIVEDSMIDLQETSSGIDSNYRFDDVFRDMVTSEFGDPVASKLAVKPAGTRNVRTYTYKVNPEWKPNHCRVIAFVTYDVSGGYKNVFQSVQTKLAP